MTMYLQDISDAIDRKDTLRGQLLEIKRVLPKWFYDEIRLPVSKVRYSLEFMAYLSVRIIVSNSWQFDSKCYNYPKKTEEKFKQLFDFTETGSEIVMHLKRTGTNRMTNARIAMTYVIDSGRFLDIDEAKTWMLLSGDSDFTSAYRNVAG